MERKFTILLLVLFSFVFSACSSSSDSNSSDDIQKSSTEMSINESLENQDENETINENSWDYIIANYPHVTYDEVKSGDYNNQFVILSTIIDNIDSHDNSTGDCVACDIWFSHNQSFISDDIIFWCDELPGYSPQLLVSGDNIDICFYINKDSSFGSEIKGFNKNNESITIDFVHDSFKESCSPLDYESILRSPDDFWGCTFTVSGTVFQIIEQDNDSVEFLLFTGSNNEYIHIHYYYKDNDLRVLEDDQLTIYGTFYKLYDYISMLGTNNSIPEIAVEFIDNFTAISDPERDLFFDSELSDLATSKDSSNLNDLSIGGPDELELMSYAQTVLDNNLPGCKYSRDKREYTFVKTNLRYKIEGNVSRTKDSSSEKFYMVIKFLDEKYETYDLILLQVGDETIYKSLSSNETSTLIESDDEILNEGNTKIFNEVMEKLNSDYNREEDEILEEISPNYDMTAEELKEFMWNYMEAYYQ